ncbi:MAG: hypothetical protein LCH70_06345 [Proteobacteria bacterium]|nr:hypothetical protein [Pseudomonadota bacterium]
MNRNQKVANCYYARTEIPTLRSLISPPWAIVIAPYFLLFCHALYRFLTTKNDLNYLLLAGMAEVVLLVAYGMARREGEQECVRAFNKNRDYPVRSYSELKSHLLRRITKKCSNKSISAGIDQYIDKSSRWKNIHSISRVDLPRLVYDPDSKQRIFALVIAIGAAIVALGVRNGATLDNLFSLFSVVHSYRLIYAIILLSLLFLMIAVIISYAAHISFSFATKCLFLLQGLRSRSRTPLRYLQRDLIESDRELG